MKHLGEMKRKKEVLKPSILLMFRKMPQIHRIFQLEAKPKKTDSLAYGILSDPSDKFSKLPLTRTFPENDHCSAQISRHSRTLKHPTYLTPLIRSIKSLGFHNGKAGVMMFS